MSATDRLSQLKTASAKPRSLRSFNQSSDWFQDDTGGKIAAADEARRKSPAYHPERSEGKEAATFPRCHPERSEGKEAATFPRCHPERSEGSQAAVFYRYGTIMLEKNYYVYILTNDWGNVMYIGMTSNLERRLYEHKHELEDGFTKRYHVHKLVYYEQTNDAYSAVTRERQLKGWTRKRKDALVEAVNPNWEDLSISWV